MKAENRQVNMHFSSVEISHLIKGCMYCEAHLLTLGNLTELKVVQNLHQKLINADLELARLNRSLEQKESSVA